MAYQSQKLQLSKSVSFTLDVELEFCKWLLQHYILRSPVIDLTGTPEVALYFALLGATTGQKCVVYAINPSEAEAPGVVFSDHSFLILPPRDGGAKHRWLRQDGYSVGPADWSNVEAVDNFDLLTLSGVDHMCFEKGHGDEKLVSGLGDLESLDDDPLASRVRGAVNSIARAIGAFDSPGIQEILKNSKTRDPDSELADEIDRLIAIAKGDNALQALVQDLEGMKKALNGGYWDTSWSVGLWSAQKRLAT